MTNLDRILKNRAITLPTKVRLVKDVVFPVVMYGCESRTIKKAECRKIDAFELWCWRRLFFFFFSTSFLVLPHSVYTAVPETKRKQKQERAGRRWRRFLRVPWTTRRSNQSILKEISPGCSLEGLMLKLKLQYSGHLI